MSETATGIAPIVKAIETDRPIDEAFRLFTANMADWWPLASHSVGRDKAQWCGLEDRVGGRVFERTESGEEHVWGTVTDWQPPHRLAFTWHPGQGPEVHTELVIRFTALAERRTRVELEHRGWEALGDRAEAVRGNYDGGWDQVFGRHFGEFAAL